MLLAARLCESHVNTSSAAAPAPAGRSLAGRGLPQTPGLPPPMPGSTPRSRLAPGVLPPPHGPQPPHHRRQLEPRRLGPQSSSSGVGSGSGGRPPGARPPGARQPGTSRSRLASTRPGTANRSSSAAAADKSSWLGLLRCWRSGWPHRRRRACTYPRAPLGAPASWPLAVPEPARAARRLAAARAVAVARASS